MLIHILTALNYHTLNELSRGKTLHKHDGEIKISISSKFIISISNAPYVLLALQETQSIIIHFYASIGLQYNSSIYFYVSKYVFQQKGK